MKPRRRWQAVRGEVYERDGGTCQVCGIAVPWHLYHCGHMVDRCVGGSDEAHNLVVMCGTCNLLKPVHTSRAAYLGWVRDGYWIREMTPSWLAIAENCKVSCETDDERRDVLEACVYLTRRRVGPSIEQWGQHEQA